MLSHPAVGAPALYLDGRLEVELPYTGTPGASEAPIVVGPSSGGIVTDELALYRRSLGPAEVGEHDRDGLAGEP